MTTLRFSALLATVVALLLMGGCGKDELDEKAPPATGGKVETTRSNAPTPPTLDVSRPPSSNR